jgi:hypothetical protein
VPLAQAPIALKVADLEMDLISRKVSRAGRELDLRESSGCSNI